MEMMYIAHGLFDSRYTIPWYRNHPFSGIEFSDIPMNLSFFAISRQKKELGAKKVDVSFRLTRNFFPREKIRFSFDNFVFCPLSRREQKVNMTKKDGHASL